MDTTVDALKTLYAAYGGSSETVANLVTIPDMINALAALIAAGGGAILPKVDTDDNGKVLKVASGKWAVGTDNTGT